MAENWVRNRLLDQRRALLDLGVRNRLINVPMRADSALTIEIVDEKSIEIYRSLIEGKALTFLPGRMRPEAGRGGAGEEDRDGWGMPQPPETEVDERAIFRRQTETRLQTSLTSEGLQKKLFDLCNDARTFEEEHGTNALFLAIGVLRWFEDDRSDAARHAPLVLLPVNLGRASAADRFTLRARDEPPTPNPSIQARLRQEFGIAIESFADEDAVDVPAYLSHVAAAVSGRQRWKVLPDTMVLGLFSFSKLLMYRDLDPANWPDGAAPHDNALVASLLGDGFARQEPIVGDGEPIDDVIPPAALNHVVDADASQAVAIEEVLRGRNLVVKGPPGTGKSQTITNIVAGAVLQGRKVLFVAQKKAALETVQRRLRQVGLGPVTLELHSAKTAKRALIDELRRTRDLSSRPAPEDISLVEHMADTQAGLNHHAAVLHAALQPSGLTAYQVLGRLLGARDRGGLPGFEIAGAAGWTGQEARMRLDLAARIAHSLEAIGDPAAHAWRGVEREALVAGDRDRLTSLLHNIEADIETLTRTADAIGKDFGVEIDRLADFETLARAVKATVALPPQVDRSAMANPVWRKSFSAINELIALGRSYRKFADAMALAYRPQAWRFDLRLIRDEIAAHNVSWMRFLKGPYRDAMEQFRSLLAIEVPADRGKQVSLLDGMILAQETRRRFEAQRTLGAEAFGTLWHDAESDWDSLQAIADWWRDNRHAASADSFAARLSVVPRGKERGAPGASLAQGVPRLFADLGQLQQFLHLDLGLAFGVGHWTDLNVSQLTARLRLWLDDIDALKPWIAFGEGCRGAGQAGLGALIDGLRGGSIAGAQFVPTCERAYYEALRTDFLERLPDLKRFDGELQDLMVESFRVLDHGRIALARETVATRHLEARPAVGGSGPAGVLDAELGRKSHHLPIRELLGKAGTAVQQLKPVFLMSPLSVSRFLAPGALTFDLLVIDEASQIEPLDAVGALARARQVVVVGDERQLPPARHFAALVGDAGEEEEEGPAIQGGDAESVLDLCLARGMPFRVLDWHYRSRHPSLIAVSNGQFYDNRLMAAPSPVQDDAALGLVFHHLPRAYYDRGHTRTNAREARTVAEAVMAYARNHGDRREAQSLGVVTFSTAQRNAILRELELLRRAAPECEAFFNSDSIEPFFVKTVENVQGDERDVIFISVGYGRDAEGYLAMNFGPLNREGGERRLNVLISRARYRCEVFSSITAEDIDADRAGSAGVAALKAFLDFAREGAPGPDIGRMASLDSPFEDAVAAQLRARGHKVVARVGSMGYHVDLAVVDPDRPGRYVLAVECDGAQYHAARSARDRDRLRQQVLENQGWIVHRIWSMDWFERPEEEIAKVEAAIVKARLAWQQRDDDLVSPSAVLEPIFEPLAADASLLSGPDTATGAAPVEAEPGKAAAGEPPPAEPGEAMPRRVDAAPAPSFVPAVSKAVELQALGPRITMSWPAEVKPAASKPVEFGAAESGAALFRFSEFRPAQIRHGSADWGDSGSRERRSVEARWGETRRVETGPAAPGKTDSAARPRDPRRLDFESIEPSPIEPAPVEPDWTDAQGAGPDGGDMAADAAEADAGEPASLEEAVSADEPLPSRVYRDVLPSAAEDTGPVEAGLPGSRSPLSQSYREAVLQVSTRHELQELSAARMAVYVTEVVRVEGPVHEQEIIARIRGAFGLGRAGVRVREAVLDGIDAARITGKIVGGPFYMLPAQPVVVRDRSQTTSPGLRKLDMLPPQEIEAALVAVIKFNLGAPRDALLVAVSRALGFAATSGPLRERLEEILDAMLARRELSQRNNLVVAVH